MIRHLPNTIVCRLPCFVDSVGEVGLMLNPLIESVFVYVYIPADALHGLPLLEALADLFGDVFVIACHTSEGVSRFLELFGDDLGDGRVPVDTVMQATVFRAHHANAGTGGSIHDGVERLYVCATIEIDVGHTT